MIKVVSGIMMILSVSCLNTPRWVVPNEPLWGPRELDIALDRAVPRGRLHEKSPLVVAADRRQGLIWRSQAPDRHHFCLPAVRSRLLPTFRRCWRHPGPRAGQSCLLLRGA